MIRSDLGAIDLRSLAAFRIGLAATLLLDLVYRSADLEAHYSDAGVMPRSALAHFLARPGWLWSLHAISGDAAAQALLMAVAAAAAVALGVGYRTRAAALASWLLLASLQHRNPLILIAGDRLLLLLLLWGLFLPMGARWSVDARAERSPDATHCTGFPAWALLLQTALVYASTALYKWAEPVWRQLDAVARTLEVEGVATAVGRGLLGCDGLPALLTATVLGVETLAPVLAFSPWRRPQVRVVLVLALVSLHLLGLGVALRLGLMQLVMSVAWLPFLPQQFWDGLRRPRREGGAPGMRAIRASRLETALALGCFTLVLVDAAIALDRPRFEGGAPRWSTWLIGSLDLRQEWRMWQRPLRNRYHVFAAQLEDGRQIDLHTGRALDWDAPRRRSKNNHWWKYQDHLSRPIGRPFRAYYVRYLAREWDRTHPEGPAVARLSWVYLDASRPSASKGRLPRRTLWEGELCGDGSGALSRCSAPSE